MKSGFPFVFFGTFVWLFVRTHTSIQQFIQQFNRQDRQEVCSFHKTNQIYSNKGKNEATNKCKQTNTQKMK